MAALPQPWDYLVVTAANHHQASAFQSQVQLRRELGRLVEAREVLVIPDFEDRRIGSGASTINCLREILRREAATLDGWPDVQSILQRLRILIVHAGGDARRLPAYSALGKIFMPLPGHSDSVLPLTMFDRLLPNLLQLPLASHEYGQVLIASGDALIEFDPAAVSFAPGATVLAAGTSPEDAARHGVFCAAPDHSLRLYLQKPSIERQSAVGALDNQRRALLDLGVMNLDALTATRLLRVFCQAAADSGENTPLAWTPAARSALASGPLDLYREICAALGSDATLNHYLGTAQAAGSVIDPQLLARWFDDLRSIPVNVTTLQSCRFLHFGATRQLITSGVEFLSHEGAAPDRAVLIVNCELQPDAAIAGGNSWLEACRLAAPLTLEGENVVVGIDVDVPLRLPPGACIDVSPGFTRNSQPCWFIRCYGVDDTFKQGAGRGAIFCGLPLLEWLASVGADPATIWANPTAADERTLWNARVFPAQPTAADFRRWLWMFEVRHATPEQKAAFLAADRYSCAEIALHADVSAFQRRRMQLRLSRVSRDLPRLFSRASRFSADELAFALAQAEDPAALASEVLALANASPADDPLCDFTSARILHSLGTAITSVPATIQEPIARVLGKTPGLQPAATPQLSAAASLHSRAFELVTRAIVGTSLYSGEIPRSALRPDECVWGRAPARIELGGGWTDTPPYTLEFGGHVTNTAIDLNGQPPIHCYLRVIPQPVIRLHSTDSRQHIEISELPRLLDYSRPGDPFALAKAALALAGFSPAFARWPAGIPLADMLHTFGGGIELTTLVGIPQGSGLGTSSILAAVVLAAIQRAMGRQRTTQELFHDVLRLEQALTTGGGWQDQVGGCIAGSKITATAPGLFPQPQVEPLPSDVLDPQLNGGLTLLYYTGLTRLAKNILQEIVGAYLDRAPRIMAALHEEHLVARALADAMIRKDIASFGRYVDVAWELQKRLCGNVTNDAIESLLRRVRPHVHGMRISGAGSGGFLIMICKSPPDAAAVRDLLQRQPLNQRSRFFDFSINLLGLQVTTC